VNRFQFLILFALLVTLASCGGDTTTESTHRVNVYGWINYFPPDMLKQFTKDTGIEVVLDTYASNEELMEKLNAGVSDYDVANPSDYLLAALIQNHLLEPLDHSQLHNLNNTAERFRNSSFDPGSQYSVPFLLSFAGIGYDRTKVKETVDSWGILWNPKYKDHILMLDDPMDCFAVALKWMGYSVNTQKREELEAARDALLKQKSLVKVYNSTNYDEILASGDVWLAHGWNGDIAKVAAHNPNIGFVVPREGSALSVDYLVIPRTARHKREAHTFINYFLSAQVGAAVTNFNSFSTANEAAKPFIQRDLLKNLAVFPDIQIMKRLENVATPSGETAQLRDRFWTEVKSR
jgi:spermidine/putrescine-binding protein